MLKISYQGIAGAYSHLACYSYFGKDIECIGTETFEDAMALVEEEKADFALIPIENKTAGRVKIVFLKTKNNLIPILSTNIKLTDERIIEIYKKRWNIEQGYKELREHFGFGKEENRIYEALIAKITLSMFAYNIVSYINRIKHEPQTLGELFRDLECELETLAISMQLFIQILTKISEIQNVVKDNKDLLQIIAVLSAYTQKELGFMCES